MVVGLIVEEISNVDAKCVKVTGGQNIGQGHRVKVPAESVHLGEALDLQDLVVVRLIVEKIWNFKSKLCQSQWSAKYRSRSLGQCTCQVWGSGRCVMQGMMVVVEL